MSLSAILSAWRTDLSIAPNVTAWRTFPARPAQHVPFPDDMHPALADALRALGIHALYTHQAVAWQHARAGHHLVVVTGTASGKTLCYNLPVLDRLLRDPEARALYLFPTKALAQDQQDALRQLVAACTSPLHSKPPSPEALRSKPPSPEALRSKPPSPGASPLRSEPPSPEALRSKPPSPEALRSKPPSPEASPLRSEPPSPGASPLRSEPPSPGASLRVATYDGDLPTSARPAVRAGARLVISNPDMLHTGILPHHTQWVDLMRCLQFVIVDEIHAYRGVFGSHVANVLRRLKRVAGFYGASPQFILTSATIANPAELASRLIEEPVELVENDGSPRGEKHFLIYNPPAINPEIGLRRSTLLESVRLAQGLLRHDVQTIVFARTRQAVELTLSYLRSSLLFPTLPHSHTSSPSSSIRGYRSGYLPRQRREIERGLREGQVRAVVATTALELGIDIGGMGAAVLAGYPGTIAGTWQQAGRAGRTQEASLAILLASANPLDQFLAHHPDYFFGRSPEQALINPDNLLILLGHLRCAAFELPFQVGERFGRVDGARVAEFLHILQETGVLYRSGDKYFWMADQYPAAAISLRNASPETVVLQAQELRVASDELRVASDELRVASEDWTTIGQVDGASARWMVHPGAIYLHEGQMYLVEELDLGQQIARLRATDVGYYTQPRSETAVQLLARLAEAQVCGGTKAHGEICVTSQVIGYRKVKWFTHEQLGVEELDMPPTELVTTGYWLALAEETVACLRDQGMWTNDPNAYGPNWQAQRDRARARDGYRCQNCGAPEEGQAHHVHHKVPFRAFASYQQANQLSNLATLCPRCHQRAELAVRAQSGLSGLAFALGHLAPLFLMCDARDLGLHADPRSPLAEGRPAVVVYDQVPAGIGFSERLFELHDELIGRARELVGACACADGCPSCTGPAGTGPAGEGGLGGKRETLALLEALSISPAQRARNGETT